MICSMLGEINDDFVNFLIWTQFEIYASLPNIEMWGECNGLFLFVACKTDRVRLLYY